MVGLILALTVFLPSAWAFSDTSPLLVWSSHRVPAAGQLASYGRVAEQHSAVEVLLNSEDLCSFDTVVLIEHPGLHADDLRTLSPSSTLSTALSKRTHSLQLPHVRHSSPSTLMVNAEAFAERCGMPISYVTLGEGHVHIDSTRKHVLCMSMPRIAGSGAIRRERMAQLESTLSREITALEAVFAKHLFVYTGSPESYYEKRQAAEDGIPPPFDFAPDVSDQPSSRAGIFKRYQLFTPGLITALLVSFFLVVPIVMLGIRALASIQSPVRLDAPKGPSQEKKNQ